MTNEKQEATVFWPDLSRFGAKLSVAFNPSTGRNFLKFTVENPALLAQTAAYPQGTQLYQWLREVGFAFDGTEGRRDAVRERDARLAAGTLSDEDMDRLNGSDRRQHHFYAPMAGVTKSLVQHLVPAVEDSDFRRMPVSEVKHLDCRILSKDVESSLTERMADFGGDEPGVLFITPQDRAWWEALSKSDVDLISVMLQRADPLRVVGDVREFQSRFVATDVTSQMLSDPLLLPPNGEPLRGIPARAVAMGYVTRAAAVAANGGSEEGIERVEVRHGLPLGIDPLARRVAVAREGRFLGFYPQRSATVNEGHLQDIRSPGQQFVVADLVSTVKARWQAAVAAGAMDQEAWTHEKLEQVMPLLQAVEDAIQDIGADAGLERSERPLGGVFVSRRLRTTPSWLSQAYGEDFAAYLERSAATLESAKERLAGFRAEQVALQGMEKALASVGATPAASTQRREDAGEKIGGARKDYAKRWLYLDEVSGMTPSEWKDVVTKDNVWPSLDYKAMRENGVAPDVAWAIRELRSSLPVNPYRGGYNVTRRHLNQRANADLTQEQCEAFVRSVSLVRDCVGSARTWPEFMAGCLAIREDCGLGVYRKSDERYYRGGRTWDSDNWFGDGAGYAFCTRNLPEVYLNSDGDLDSWSFDKIKSVALSKSGQNWDWAIKDKVSRPKPEGEKVKKPEPEYEHLENIRRIGPDFRQGKDVDEQMLLSVFGFRGIEYGNWLPQAERQVVLNHAFDAFMDLSAVIKVPPRLMSLGGKLALAFGARGTGGKQAARAHFESGRFVMNLTRLSGAGCVAHEWGHAFDLALSQTLGASTMRFLSEFADKGLRSSDKLVADFFKTVRAAMKRPMSREEFVASVSRVKASAAGASQVTMAEHGQNCMRQWLRNINYRLSEELSGGAFMEFGEALLARHFQPVKDAELAAAGVQRFVDPELFVESLRSYVPSEMRDKVAESLSISYPRQINRWMDSLAARATDALASFTPDGHMVDTRMLTDAQYFDGFRSKPYWSTTLEIFARSFEAWVQNRIEAGGQGLSQYLVHGCRPREDVEYSVWPRGQDREAICAAFDDFFQDCRPRLMQLLQAEDKVEQEVTPA